MESTDPNQVYGTFNNYINTLKLYDNDGNAKNGILTNQTPTQILEDIVSTFSYKTEFEIQHMFNV